MLGRGGLLIAAAALLALAGCARDFGLPPEAGINTDINAVYNTRTDTTNLLQPFGPERQPGGAERRF